MTDNINNSPDEEKGLKSRYATVKEIPHTCDTCSNLIEGKKTGKKLCLYNIMDRVMDDTDETWYQLPEEVNGCQHWNTTEICADCKYAINPRYHNEAVGFATFTCKCYKKTVIDIEVACKRYRLRGGDTT